MPLELPIQPHNGRRSSSTPIHECRIELDGTPPASFRLFPCGTRRFSRKDKKEQDDAASMSPQALRRPESDRQTSLVHSGRLPNRMNRESLIVADRFASLPALRVANERAVLGKRAVRRMHYLRACPAVTRFAILFAGRPLRKNHGCCVHAGGFNAPKSRAGVFHGRPRFKHRVCRKVLRFCERQSMAGPVEYSVRLCDPTIPTTSRRKIICNLARNSKRPSGIENHALIPIGSNETIDS